MLADTDMARAMSLVPLLLLLTTFILSDAVYTCPPYEEIRQPSVAPGKFDAAELEGIWYITATNEPTMPAFCRCGVNTYAVHEAAGGAGGWYSYTNRDYCVAGAFKKNITITIKGNLNKDKDDAGFLMENFALFNHTVVKPAPNYIFNIERDADGTLARVYSYACIGKMPFHKTESFAFYLLERAASARVATTAAIGARVAAANASTAGLLDFAKLRVDNATHFNACGMLT